MSLVSLEEELVLANIVVGLSISMIECPAQRESGMIWSVSLRVECRRAEAGADGGVDQAESICRATRPAYHPTNHNPKSIQLLTKLTNPLRNSAYLGITDCLGSNTRCPARAA